MPEKIVLAYDVQTSKAEAEVKGFSRTVETESAKSAAAAEKGASRVETQTASMAQSFKGAGTAISAANASLVLLGQQGPPALQTLASAAGSLVASGFGPMGLALAGATGLVSLVSALGNESEAAAEKMRSGLEAALASGSQRADQLLERIVALNDQLESLRSGQTLGAVTAGRQVGEMRDELAQVYDALKKLRELRDAEFESQYASLPADRATAAAQRDRLQGTLSGIQQRADRGSVLANADFELTTWQRHTLSRDEMFRETETALLDRIGQLSTIINRTIAEETKSEEVRVAQETRKLLAGGGVGMARDILGPSTGLGIGAGPTLGGNTEWHRLFQQADLDRMAQEERDAAAAERERAASLEARRALFAGISQGDPTQDSTNAELARMRQVAEERARLFREAEERQVAAVARAQAEAFSGSISNAFVTAIHGGGLAGFFVQIEQALTNSIAEAFIRGAIQALGVQSAAETIFKSLANALVQGFGGSGNVTTPNAIPNPSVSAKPLSATSTFPEGFSGADLILDNYGGKGASARGPEQIVVVMAPDESVADAMANKISAGGARAVVARAQGRGVMAGRLGPRRG